jgi:multicomponent K+:H+ antiporter subunit D
MNWPHWIVMPIIAPLMTGALLVLLERRESRHVRSIALFTSVALLLLSVFLIMLADDGTVRAYLLGNWTAPFGISLALDRLSALMLLLTSIVGLAGLLYAGGGDARRGAHFHALMMFQLAGLNGAFLTADLFNLFVFFEVLLIASYGLLLHGGGPHRLRAAIHYVAFNLAGSALFLIAVSLIYGLTGTLAMADLATRIATLPATDATLIRIAGTLLLIVFCVKAALLPLYFWLPETYSAASAPAAAVFAIMTKVGVYAIARVGTLAFGVDSPGPAAGLFQSWMPAFALATLALGATGAVAARRLRVLVAYLVVASAGTLITAIALGTAGTLSAGLFYLIHSTLVAAAMFLLVDRMTAARGRAADMIEAAGFGAGKAMLGAGFFLLALAFAGMPPLAGFIGKALLLQASADTSYGVWVWMVVLPASLAMIVALSRAGSMVFWQPSPEDDPLTKKTSHAVRPGAVGIGSALGTDGTGSAGQRAALVMLGTLLIGSAILAGPIRAYTGATADQLLARGSYIDALQSARPVAPRLDVRREMREQGKLKGQAKDAANSDLHKEQRQ